MVAAQGTILLVASLAGIGLVPFLRRRPHLLAAGTAFAAGILLPAIFIHMLPEAMARSELASVLFVLGFVGMLLLSQHVLKTDPCCDHEHAQHAGLPSYVALALCSVNDGLIMGADVECGFASTTLWAMVLHKVSSSFALVMLLASFGYQVHRLAGVLALVAFAAITPATMVLATQVEAILPYTAILQALASGAMLYAIAETMLPRMEHAARDRGSAALPAFLIAVLLSIAIEKLGHQHEHPGHVHADQGNQAEPRR